MPADSIEAYQKWRLLFPIQNNARKHRIEPNVQNSAMCILKSYTNFWSALYNDR